MADSSGTTLMDLISSDPTPNSTTSSSSSSSTSSTAHTITTLKSLNSTPSAGPSSTLGKPAVTDRKSKRATLTQLQNDTISAAKALNPVRTTNRKKKKVRVLSPRK